MKVNRKSHNKTTHKYHFNMARFNKTTTKLELKSKLHSSGFKGKLVDLKTPVRRTGINFKSVSPRMKVNIIAVIFRSLYLIRKRMHW